MFVILERVLEKKVLKLELLHKTIRNFEERFGIIKDAVEDENILWKHHISFLLLEELYHFNNLFSPCSRLYSAIARFDQWHAELKIFEKYRKKDVCTNLFTNFPRNRNPSVVELEIINNVLRKTKLHLYTENPKLATIFWVANLPNHKSTVFTNFSFDYPI